MMNALILDLLALNYPILSDWYGNKDGLFIIRMSDDEVDDFIKRFSYKIVMKDNLTNKRFQEKTKYVNSRAVIYEITSNIYSYLNNEIISQLDRIAKSDEQGEAAAVFVLYTGNRPLPIEIYREYCVLDWINLEDNNDIQGIELLPSSEELSLVKHEAEKFCAKIEDRLERLLYSAAFFAYPKLKAEKNVELFEEMIQTVPAIMDMIQYGNNDESIITAFNKNIFEAVKSKRLFPIYDPLHLNIETYNTVREHVFLEGNLFYMPYDTFKDVLIDMTERYSIAHIKNVLSNNGILLRERGAYSKRMRYRNAYGQEDSTRMTVLDVSKITVGEYQLKDIL